MMENYAERNAENNKVWNPIAHRYEDIIWSNQLYLAQSHRDNLYLKITLEKGIAYCAFSSHPIGQKLFRLMGFTAASIPEIGPMKGSIRLQGFWKQEGSPDGKKYARFWITDILEYKG